MFTYVETLVFLLLLLLLIIIIIIIIIIIVIKTVALLSGICDWCMMLKLLGAGSYRRRIKDRRMKGGVYVYVSVYLLVGSKL